MTQSHSWKNCPLGEVVNLKRGYDLPKKKRQVGLYPIVSSSGITGTHINCKVKAPGVVTGRYGTLGEVFYLKEDFWPLNTSLYVQDFKGNYPQFISYFLRTLNLERQNAAGAVPGLNRNHLHQMMVTVPNDEKLQVKISSVLSAYDDLIENNTRRIAILEEMARRIYTEWFLNFHFPGHEKVKMVDSELGKIPSGWEVKTIKDVINNFDRMRKPLSKMKRQKLQGQYPYYGAAKVVDNVIDYIFDGRYLLMAEDGSVITKEGYPVLQFVDCKFWANNHTHILQGKDGITTEHLYLLLAHTPISGYITGAAQPKINQQNLNRIPAILPTEDVLNRFNEFIKPMFNHRIILERLNSNLKQTHNLLLPRLISGEIDVSELEVAA